MQRWGRYYRLQCVFQKPLQRKGETWGGGGVDGLMFVASAMSIFIYKQQTIVQHIQSYLATSPYRIVQPARVSWEYCEGMRI